MAVGNKGNSVINLTISNYEIEEVTQCKYLGVIVKSIRKNNEVMFANDYLYLCDQERNALFILHRLPSITMITPIPPKVMPNLFNTVVNRILIHRSGADSRLALSQWETSLQSNAVSRWLGANLESALYTAVTFGENKNETSMVDKVWHMGNVESCTMKNRKLLWRQSWHSDDFRFTVYRPAPERLSTLMTQ